MENVTQKFLAEPAVVCTSYMFSSVFLMCRVLEQTNYEVVLSCLCFVPWWFIALLKYNKIEYFIDLSLRM